jgi:hypothetical protein
VRIEDRSNAPFLDRIGFSGLQQPLAMTATAFAGSDPQMRNVQPATPDRCQQTADPFTARAFEEKICRMPLRYSSSGDVMQIDPVDDQLAQRASRQWVENKLRFGHRLLRSLYVGQYRSNDCG